ncbi:MAG: response regulator [Chromatiaceae bacterium]|nr:response regulator [Chromatiaceae bacterium]
MILLRRCAVSVHSTSWRQAVLIVDDVPDNIALLSALLKDRYRTRAATSGQRALDIAAADPLPDMILLDIMMPKAGTIVHDHAGPD